MSDTTDDTESSRSGPKSILGIAAVGLRGLLHRPDPRRARRDRRARPVSRPSSSEQPGCWSPRAAIAAFVVVRRRRRTASCSVPPEQVPVELGRRRPVSRRLRRAAAALFVVAAALFVVGVTTENDTHTETNEAVHDETAEAAGPDETAEAAGEDETGEAAGEGETGETAGHDESAEGSGGEEASMPRRARSWGSTPSRRAPSQPRLSPPWHWLLGSGCPIGAGSPCSPSAFGVVFTVFDIAEIGHQLDESRTGLAVLAGVIAAVHLAAAGTAAMAARRVRPS